jgi:hypothetical protein
MRRQGRVKRIHNKLGLVLPEAFAFCSDLVTGLLYFLLTRQKHENVAGSFVLVDVESRSNGGLNVVLLWLERVEDVNGKGTTWNLQKRCIVKVLLKLLSVQRR